MLAPWISISPSQAWLCQTDRAARLLEAAHERHCPLTPVLAEALARLETAEQPALEPGWGRAFALMGAAIGRPDLVGRSPFWARGIPAFAQRVAEPVVRRAAEMAGHMPLVGPVAIQEAEAVDIREAHRRIEAGVTQLLAAIEPMGRGFWVLAALSLQGAAQASTRLAQASGERSRGAALVAEPDPVVGRLLFEVPPLFDDAASRRRQRRIKARSLRKRSGERPKEGGVAGIRPSRQIDDVPDAVLSELVLPDPIVANRLLNEGFLVRHRPPLREPRRDLLVALALDRRADPGGLGAVMKAAWADAAVRLRVLLGASGRTRSDLVFAEQTATRVTRAALRVDDGQRVPVVNPLALRPEDRARMLLDSRILPAFVETRPEASAPRGPILSSLLGQAVDAMAPLPLPGDRPGRSGRPQLADYARRLMIVCVEQGQEEGKDLADNWIALRTTLQAADRRSHGAPALYAALSVPSGLAEGGVFLGQSDIGLLDRVEFAPEEEGPDSLRLARLLGDLSGWLIDLSLGALDG
jgi:hypothetical protein